MTGVLDPDRVRLVAPDEVGLAGALEPNFDGLRHQASVKAPMAAYFSARRRTSFLRPDLAELGDMTNQRFPQRLAGGIGIHVGAPDRLLHDLVDHLERAAGPPR